MDGALLDGALSRSKTDAERVHLEKALEEGREIFPASDAVAVVQPAPPTVLASHSK
jgi:hypothetical protein